MHWWLTAGLILVLTAIAPGDESRWEIAWKDEFDRETLGDDWQVNERVSIVDGWLHMPDRADVKCKRSFGPDVMVVFVARADPRRPPCDLSITLANTHLLAFGGGNNQFNQIMGGCTVARDHEPEMLIEPGKTYKLAAVKEGPRLAYYCNDKLLIETTTDDPVGGAGFDQFTLVTWHGMYVDYVHVFERTTPAPGGPAILEKMPDIGFTWDNRELTAEGTLPETVARAVKHYNRREYVEALSTLEAVNPPTLQSVAALGYVIGDIAFNETPAMQKELADLALTVASGPEATQQAEDYALAAHWFAMINHRSRNHRATQRLIKMGPENNPFHSKARMFEARYNFAHGAEGAQHSVMNEAREEFKALKEIWPEVQVLREWCGEKILWGEDLVHDEADGPAWARYLHESFVRQSRILEWWFGERQAADGSLGGGYGDDVELLRTWVPVACISTGNEAVIAGIERLAQGVWDNVLVDGYDNMPQDVQHSSEPSADSMPTMILLRYGDPLWLERNLRSARTVREKFMGINERGYLQFMSSEFGTRKANIGFQHGGDTGYCARAAKHFVWLAWYGITDARETWLDWCDTWLDVTMREIGTKPAGVAPPSIWWPDGGIDPPNGKPWYDAKSNYYGYPGLPNMVHESFLTAYEFTGDRRYINATRKMMELATIGPLPRENSDLPPDDINNVLSVVQHLSSRDLTSTYRFLTGDRTYDEYTMRHPMPIDRYMQDHDLQHYVNTFENMAKGMRYGWLMQTQEILQTDRAGMWGAQHVLGAYTGAVTTFRDSKTMTHCVTYDTPNINFAAVATDTNADRLRVRVYSFEDEPMRMGLRPWRLLPGVYVLNAGEPVPGEKDVQQRYTWGEASEVRHLRKGEPIWVEIPPHKEWAIDLRLSREIERPAEQPDLAIRADDVRGSSGKVEVTVHNIGNDPSPPFTIVLESRRADAWYEVARVRAEAMGEIKEFMPVRQKLTLTGPGDLSEAAMRVVLDPDNEVDELYELNNTVEFGSHP